MIARGFDIHGNRKDLQYGSVRLSCRNEELKTLVVPNGTKELFCSDNYIEELVLPETIKVIFCENNRIEKLYVPESTDYIKCDNTVRITNIDELALDLIDIEMSNGDGEITIQEKMDLI